MSRWQIATILLDYPWWWSAMLVSVPLLTMPLSWEAVIRTIMVGFGMLTLGWRLGVMRVKEKS